MKGFSINTIAFGNLRQHRKQYITLTLGIVLAIFFSASLLLFMYASSVCTQEIRDARYGKQDVIFFNCGDAPFDELVEKGYLETYGEAQILGYVSTETESDQASGFSIAVFDDTAKELIAWDIIEGRMPEKVGEIAVEQSALARLRIDIKVGGTFTVPVRIPDGNGGFLEETKEKTYTLVGILSDRLSNLDEFGNATPVYSDFPAGVLSDEEQIDVGGKLIVNCYANYTNWYFLGANLPDQSKNTYVQLHLALQEYVWTSCEVWDDENVTNYDMQSVAIVSDSIAIIAIALVLASCLGIINAFSANLRERQKQIGLLRAVAATKRQIRQIFGREAMLIACLSIPPAVALSCLAVWGIMSLMGPGYHFVLNVWILLGTAVVGLVCIMAAAFFPLWRASRIPPMQAIRDAALSRQMKKRNVRTKRWFDVSKHLARRNLILYRGNHLGVIALLTMSMFVLSALIYSGTLSLPDYYKYSKPYDYLLNGTNDLAMYYGLVEGYHIPGITEQDKQDIAALPTVEYVQSDKTTEINVIPSSGITNYMLHFGVSNLSYLQEDLPLSDESDEYEEYLRVKQKYGYTQDYYTDSIAGYDERQLAELSENLIEGEINLDKLASGEEVLVFAPAYIGVQKDKYGEWIPYYYTKQEEQKAREECSEYLAENDMFHAGDTIELSLLYSDSAVEWDEETESFILPDDYTRIDRTVTIGGIIDDTGLGEGSIVTSVSGLRALGYDECPYSSLEIYLSETPDSEMETYLDDSLQSIAARSGSRMSNCISLSRNERNSQYGRFISRMSIVILFFAICASMVSNSISSRIQAGKRSIGTLRAVGASEREILKSYLLQLVYLFTRGAVIGMIVEIVVLIVWRQHEVNSRTYLSSYRANVGLVQRILNDFPPIWPPLVFVLLLFVVCCFMTRAKVKAVLKSSITENIREL